MLKKIYDEPCVFQIDVPLPNNPLRNLNCYIIQDSGETLILDTGFNRPECEEALLAGLQELDADWEKDGYVPDAFAFRPYRPCTYGHGG